jgi:3'-phosphoadenosine 5'-phosphosulfate sulfotransferase
MTREPNTPGQSKSVTSAKVKKYRINELLESLSVKKSRMALRVLPGKLGISIATFNNYRAIEIDSNKDIPHTIVAKLEHFFILKPGELQNFVVEICAMNSLPDE